MKKGKIGLVYITPWIIGILVFTVYPFLASFVLSFTDYDIISSPNYIGLDNYRRMLNDNVFWDSVRATFKYVLTTVPLLLAVALFVAFVLNFKLKAINFFRTAYYIPSILGGNVAIAVLWRALFTTEGLVNQVLGIIGMDPVGWFSTTGGALFSLTLLRVWQFGSAMVIFLAALQDIPTELYEAAAIDGASKLRTFLVVTIPLLTPVIFFNLVMQLVGAFQEFNAPFLVTGGGPMRATYLISIMIYDNAFRFFRMGYASALSWVLFIIIMFFTIIVFKSSSAWVFYSDNGGVKKK